MKLKIKVLDKFDVAVMEATDELPLKQGRLLEYLALSFPTPISRRKVGNDLWPDTEPSTVNNRLRVALSGLRKQIGNTLVESDLGICLSSESVSVDWYKVHDVIVQQDHVSDLDELDTLVSVLPELPKRLLPLIEEEWIDPYRQNWIRESLRACNRIATLALQQNKYETAAEACEVGLAHDLFDESLWTLNIRAKKALGLKDEALRDFRVARQRLSAEMGLEFGQELLTFVREIRESEPEPVDDRPNFNAKELEFLGRLLEKTLETNPAEFAKIVADPACQNELLKWPNLTATVFEKLLATKIPRDSIWMDCLSRMLVARAQLHDWVAVNNVATELLELQIEDPIRLATVYFHRGFSRFQIRDWDGALGDIDKTTKIMTDAGDEARVRNAIALKASMILHLERYDEAIAIYLEQEDYFKDSTEQIAKHNKVVRRANLALANIFLNDLPTAMEYGSSATKLATEIGQDSIISMLYPQNGYLYMMSGDLLQGAEFFIQGLKAGYERDDRRAMQIGLEYAAACIAVHGTPDFANQLFAWVNQWRASEKHLRSPSEEAFVSRFITSDALGPLEGQALKQVILSTFRHLRRITQTR